MNPTEQAKHNLKGLSLLWLRLRFPLVCRWANLVLPSWAQLRPGWTSAAALFVLQLLICCERISQRECTARRQTTHTVSVHTPPLACLPSSSWNKTPPEFWLLSVLPSHHQSFHGSPLAGCSCLSWLPGGSLSLFRQDLSSSVKLQSSHQSVGCLERLTMTYQTLQTFNRRLSSTRPPL